jgi:hypothetical protein
MESFNFSVLVGVLGVLSVIINGIAMSTANVKKAKIYLGTAVLFIVPDFYVSGGLHGSYQSLVIALMCFLGALEYRKAEKAVLYLIPFFSAYLLFGLQELAGIIIVIASVTTPLATISRNPNNMKLLLVVSTLCWGTYAYLYAAWFAFAFDLSGMIGLMIYFDKTRRTKNRLKKT